MGSFTMVAWEKQFWSWKVNRFIMNQFSWESNYFLKQEWFSIVSTRRLKNGKLDLKTGAKKEHKSKPARPFPRQAENVLIWLERGIHWKCQIKWEIISLLNSFHRKQCIIYRVRQCVSYQQSHIKITGFFISRVRSFPLSMRQGLISFSQHRKD